MIFRRRFVLFLVSALITGLVPARGEHHGRDRDDDGHGGRESVRRGRGDSALEDVMEEMSENFRKLRRQVEDKAQNASSLALVARLRELAAQGAGMKPRMIARAAADEQPKLLRSYQEQMRELAATFGDLEAALRAGKNGKAASIVEDIRELQKAGHHKFRTED